MDRRIQRAIATVDRRLAYDVTVVTLAADVNLSPSRFAHLFRSEVGTSPTRFIRAQRMIRAYLLLVRTFLTVKEVMARVGCNDASHFSRDFRRFHGFSPSATRHDDHDAYRDLMAELLTGAVSGAIPRVAAMANERFGSPRKNPARARSPDLRCRSANGAMCRDHDTGAPHRSRSIARGNGVLTHRESGSCRGLSQRRTCP